MKSPLKLKLIFLILIVLLPMLLYSLSHYFVMLEKNKSQTQARNAELAQSIAVFLDNKLEKSFAVMRTLAEHPAVITRNTQECDALFARLLPAYPHHLNILAATMDGDNYGSGVQSPDVHQFNYRDKEWFQKGAAGQQTTANLHISKLFNTASVMVVSPVLAGEKQVGVLGFPLNLNKLNELIKQIDTLPADSTLKVIDASSTIILDIRHPENIGKRETDPYLRHKEHSGSGAPRTDAHTDADGIEKLYSFAATTFADWHVVVAVPTKSAYLPAHQFVNKYLLWLAGSLIIGLLLALFLSRSITDKLATLVDGLREQERGNLAFRLNLTGHDELSSVAESFNKSAEERLRVTGQLQESEAFLHSILEGVAEGVVVIDRDYRIITSNSSYCTQVGLPCNEIIGRTCHEVSHHSERPCNEGSPSCACGAAVTFASGEPQSYIHEHHDGEGNHLFVEVTTHPLRDAQGKITSVIETLVDVTETLKLRNHLEELMERYRKLYDEAPDMMHTIDAAGNIVFCNQTESRVLGYTQQEIIGRPFEELVTAESGQACRKKFQHLMEAGSVECEATMVAKNGDHIQVLVKATVKYDKNGQFAGADAILRDIGEMKALEAQLIHAQKMEAIGRLTGGLAHDFNNFLTAIIGYGTLMRRKVANDEALETYADKILSAADKASALIQNLLTYSRKQPTSLEPVDVNDVVHKIDSLLTRLIGEDVELTTTVAKQNLTIMGNPGQIEQVLMNLATNARDAMAGKGALTINATKMETTHPVQMREGLIKPGRYALILISDNGQGMDEATRERIFEPFFTTKELGKGTGLGLSIIYGIIKQHDGYITVDSAPGRGTTFTIYLPLIDSEAKPKEVRHSAPEQPGTETILLVEDNPDVREMMAHILGSRGYTLLEADDGEAGIATYREHADEIDLLILDVIMPKKNGRQVYDEIREQNAAVKAIFTSGYTADIITTKGIQTEGLNFLEKPITPDALLSMVRKVLDS